MLKTGQSRETSVKAKSGGNVQAMPLDRADRAAQNWLATKSKLDSLVSEWQRLEHQLSVIAPSLKMTLTAAYQSNLPEAKAMRILDKKIAATQECLNRRLQLAREAPATSVHGAIAKIELALWVQGRYDWQENARELLEEGIADLRGLTAAEVS